LRIVRLRIIEGWSFPTETRTLAAGKTTISNDCKPIKHRDVVIDAAVQNEVPERVDAISPSPLLSHSSEIESTTGFKGPESAVAGKTTENSPPSTRPATSSPSATHTSEQYVYVTSVQYTPLPDGKHVPTILGVVMSLDLACDAARSYVLEECKYSVVREWMDDSFRQQIPKHGKQGFRIDVEYGGLDTERKVSIHVDKQLLRNSRVVGEKQHRGKQRGYWEMRRFFDKTELS
jgi:hypothetical protein